MADRRPTLLRRGIRSLIVLASTVGGLTAVRNVILARNEKRFADVVADPSGEHDH